MRPLSGTSRTAADPISGIIQEIVDSPALGAGLEATAEAVEDGVRPPEFTPAATGRSLLIEAEEVGGSALRDKVVADVEAGNLDGARRTIEDFVVAGGGT